MTRCLSNEAIFRAVLGEASEAERSHAQACVGCRSRLRDCAADLDELRDVFRSPPPRAASPRRHAALRAIAAAAVVLIAIGLSWSRLRTPAPPAAVASSRPEPYSRYAREVSSAVFESCTGRRFVETGCNDYTSALFF